VKRYLGDIRLSSITRETIEGFQAKRRVDGASNRAVNMDVGALRRVLKRFKHWHRLEDDVKMLTESGDAPIGRVLSDAEQERLFEVAKGNSEWTHVYCAAVLAANTSMRGVEIKHLRRRDIDLEASALHIRKSKNEGSKRILPLNEAALGAVKTMIERADELGHKDPEHYLWCANQHHKLDPTNPGQKWDTAWRALRDAAGLRGLRFHDLRHTVVTRRLEGRRTRPRRGINHGPSFAPYVGALFAHKADGQEGGTRSPGPAAKGAKMIRPPDSHRIMLGPGAPTMAEHHESNRAVSRAILDLTVRSRCAGGHPQAIA
jgi:integrase